MAFKEILVLLDDRRSSELRLRTALSLARRDAARLVAIYHLALPQRPAVPMRVGEAVYGTNDAAFAGYERERDTALSDAEHLEAEFRQAALRDGVPCAWELWPERPREMIDLAVARARYADLAILGQADPDHPLFDTLAKLPEEVMLGSGRPTLIVPRFLERGAVGKRVLIAWNGSREAARAVADAMPLLTAAEAVTVLTVGSVHSRRDDDDRPERDLVRHLAAYAVRAEASYAACDFQPADAILSRAADLGCDLLVMGGYGHSRASERILGGVTRAILQAMTVPVLMSH